MTYQQQATQLNNQQNNQHNKQKNAQWDSLWLNLHLATMQEGTGYGIIENAAIAVKDGKIAWLGRQQDLPGGYFATAEYDGKGCWMTPGLIDCHTHLVYAGNRSDEFEARLNGVAYEEIARKGGGILSTVRATRAATPEQLLQESLPRLQNCLQDGVTTLEIKSGYGLDLATEAKILRLARQIGRDYPVRVMSTFLGAHAVPPEFSGRADAYIDHLCEQMLPALAAENLVDAVDVFAKKLVLVRLRLSAYFRLQKSMDCR